MFKLQQGGSPFFPKSVCVRMCPCEDGDGLVAATSSDHHVAVFLENDVRAVVEVEHRDGIELRGGTAGFRNCLWVNEMNLGRGGGKEVVKKKKKKVFAWILLKMMPFWIIKHSCSNSGYIVLTFDEMIRLLTWLLHFFPSFYGYSQVFAQWHGLWRSCRSSTGRHTLPRNSMLHILLEQWSSPESGGEIQVCLAILFRYVGYFHPLFL